MKPSKQQQVIYDEYVNTDNNICVNAAPGSGKSTVLKNIVRLTPPNMKIIYLAFNKSIASDIESSIDPRCEVKTIHSKGYGILRQNIAMNVKLSEFKNFGYASRVVKQSGFKDKKARNAYIFSISNIINMLKTNFLEPTEENVYSMCDNYEVIATPDTVSDVKKTFSLIDKEESNLNTHQTKEINFTDMLYLTIKKVDENMFPKYDVVLVDEVQDLSYIQKELILRLVKKLGRIILVGDDRQVIYSFAGASLKGFRELQSLPNTTILPLKESYRCPHSVVREASKVFPGITAFEKNPEGVIRHGSFMEAENEDFVLCRNNKPLVDVFIYMLRHGKKSQIKGKDFGTSLLTIMGKINTLSDLDDILQNHIQMLYDRGVENPSIHSSFQSLLEKTQIVTKLSVEFGGLSKAKNIVTDLFSDNIKNAVILSTIHKSKGLETDRVFFMDEDLIDDVWHGDFESMDPSTYSEKCLRYVCLTRAKKELVYCFSPEKMKDETEPGHD